jgi:hypothetical protein
LLGVPSLLVLLGFGIVIFRGTDLEPYKPFWLLMREHDTPAIVELNRRATAGRLSQDQDQRLLAAALDAQADLKQPWLVAWGNLIESLRAAGKVPDKDWRRYARQAVNFRLEPRHRVRIGDDIPIRTVFSACRVGASSQLAMHARITNAFLDGIGMEKRAVDDPNRGNPINYVLAGSGGRITFDCFQTNAKTLARLAPGDHLIHAQLSIAILDPHARGWSGPPLLEWTDDLQSPIILAASNQPTVELITDSRTLRKVRAAISIPQEVNLEMGSQGVEVRVRTGNLPIGIAFDPIIRDPVGRKWAFPSAALTPGQA